MVQFWPRPNHCCWGLPAFSICKSFCLWNSWGQGKKTAGDPNTLVTLVSCATNPPQLGTRNLELGKASSKISCCLFWEKGTVLSQSHPSAQAPVRPFGKNEPLSDFVPWGNLPSLGLEGEARQPSRKAFSCRKAYTHTCSETSYRITDVECIVRAKKKHSSKPDRKWWMTRREKQCRRILPLKL